MTTQVVSLALQQRYPNGVRVEWSDATGSYLGLELPDGTRVVDTAYNLVATAEQLARKAEAEAATTRAEDLKTKLMLSFDDLKAGTLTFGSAARDRAMKRTMRALKYVLTGTAEADEE